MEHHYFPVARRQNSFVAEGQDLDYRPAAVFCAIGCYLIRHQIFHHQYRLRFHLALADISSSPLLHLI